jgi:hypothetical protein
MVKAKLPTREFKHRVRTDLYQAFLSLVLDGG